MHTKIFFFILCVGLLDVLFLSAQNKPTHIIDDLQSQTNSSEGIIRVISDPEISALLGNPSNQMNMTENFDFVERTGYRIQVFMGNDPSTARSEASSRQATIKGTFPELSTYLNYEAPNWKLSAGDFVTREEATVFKQKIQKEFPQFGKEMYIIVDKIKIPVDRGE